MPSSWFPRARRSAPVTVAAVLAVFATAVGVLAAPASAAPAVTRLVAGGSAVTDPAGGVWAPDTPAALGGRVSAASLPVRGTASPTVFATQRVAPTGYRIPVSGQTNVVTLGFVDQQYATAGRRVFDVVAEGATRVAGVDPAGAVGRGRAYRVSFVVQVTDGQLDLSFVARVGVPVVSNLTVASSGRPSGATPTGTTGNVTPEAYGAKGDGVTDDTVALQRAFDAAPVGRAVVLATGRTYVHTQVLHLRTPWLHVTGAGVLLATVEARSSVWIEADHVLVDGGVVIRTASTTRRWDAWEQMGVRIVGHTGVTLRSVTVDGAAAAGVYVGNGATRFVLDHVTVQDTRADGIHMTAGANHGTVIAPVVRRSGDDGVAVVSYRQDGTACHDITVSSPTVLGTTWGRGVSVVGGLRVSVTDVDLRDTSAAAVYIASEGSPWFTAAPQNVTVSGGSITGANTDTGVDHGAVLVLSGQRGYVPSTVVVKKLQITGTRASASRNLGVITYGDAPQGVLFSDIAIAGGPRSAYQGNTPTSAYRLVGVTHDGVVVPVTG